MAVLDGRAALITGSGRGIGRATAELLVEHGASGGTQLIFGRVPKAERVGEGEVVTTVGTQLGALPDIYPRGILIGTVTSVNQNDVDPYKQILIEPFADFSSLDSVAVLIARKTKR